MGVAILRVVPRKGKSKEDALKFMQEIQDKIGAAIELRLELVEKIKMNARGKRKMIEQELDLGKYR